MKQSEIEEVLDTCACFRARAMARRLTREYSDAVRPLGLSATQFTLLVLIKSRRPKSITDMAQMLAMERTSLLRTITLMEYSGWVRLATENSRQQQKVKLTRSGERLLVKALPKWRQAQREFEQRVGADKWRETKDWFLTLAFGN